MKVLRCLLLLALGFFQVEAVTPSKELDPVLLDLFEQGLLGPAPSEIEGQEFVAELTVRMVSDRFLVFSDAYVQIDEETKYQIGKWIFTPEQLASVPVKAGESYLVTFKIQKVMREEPYEDMPHFVALILSFEAVDQDVDLLEGP
ncbi:hypothetical protein P3T73_07425 [Kiritimatiellota bacterium B12222]|nr:hypothetical protein P3T73_07425 [Kiritimatiellota bacterium B12222]